MNIFKKTYNGAKNLFTKSKTINSEGNLAVLEDFTNLMMVITNSKTLADKGYVQNVIASTAIRKTAQAMNEIPVKFMQDGKELNINTSNRLSKSILRTLQNPCADMSKNELLQHVNAELALIGEGYLYLKDDALGMPSSFEWLRAGAVTKQQSQNNKIHEYWYNEGTDNYKFTRSMYYINNALGEPNPDNLQGRFNLITWKNYNPLSTIDGLSMITPASTSVDGMNNAMAWNNQVMKNSGKISGVMSFDPETTGLIDQETLELLKEKIHRQTTGNQNGSILVVNTPAKFDKFSLTQQEMDFINGIVQSAIFICIALDYPPYLMGLNGATFNNQKEAKLALYTDSAIPKLRRYYDAICQHISLRYDVNLTYEFQLEKVTALSPLFQEQNDSIIKRYQSDLVTHNEARESLGLTAVKGAVGNLYASDLKRSYNPQNTQGS